MSARPGTGGLGLLIPAAAVLLAIAVGTSVGSCRPAGKPAETPTVSPRPLQSGRMPASPP